MHGFQEEEIRVEDLRTFESFKPINAMLEFDKPEMDIDNYGGNSARLPLRRSLCHVFIPADQRFNI